MNFSHLLGIIKLGDRMKKIFIVDDDYNIRMLVKKYIENEGYKAFLFSSGENVVNDIRRVNPDLIVLDIMMEGINGLDVCKNIRKEYEIPIIFVSARGDEIDRIVGLEIGVDDYLSKPFSPRSPLEKFLKFHFFNYKSSQ